MTYRSVMILLFCFSQRGLCQLPELTVAQLEQAIAGLHDENDEQAAAKLAGMRLTERLSTGRLRHLLPKMPGEKSREAMVGLADMSAFSNPPVSEIASITPPEETVQHTIMGRVFDYVARTNHKLPNFFATRTTIRYEDWPQGLVYKGATAGRYIPPQVVGSFQNIVTYRNGQEVATKGTNKFRKQITTDRGLYSWGLFGPLMAGVLVDASHGMSAWSRWEQDGSRRLAVFRYSIPMGESSYRVKFCCYPSSSILVPIDRKSAYHGDISVDPETGTIIRLTLIADLDRGDLATTQDLATMLLESTSGSALSRADMMVEYGPVNIGGKTYICPIRSVAISIARVPLMLQRQKSSGGQNKTSPIKIDPRPQSINLSRKDTVLELGPARIYINDISFSDYHVFRSESRIILSSQ